jgi:hypothetical protein
MVAGEGTRLAYRLLCHPVQSPHVIISSGKNKNTHKSKAAQIGRTLSAFVDVVINWCGATVKDNRYHPLAM